MLPAFLDLIIAGFENERSGIATLPTTIICREQSAGIPIHVSTPAHWTFFDFSGHFSL